jgi:hypothetical protein
MTRTCRFHTYWFIDSMYFLKIRCSNVKKVTIRYLVTTLERRDQVAGIWSIVTRLVIYPVFRTSGA